MNKYLFFLIFSILSFSFSAISFAQASNEMKTKNTALIIIDIQNFYFRGGSLPLFEAEKTAQNAKKLLSLFRDKNMAVIHVRHNTSSGGEIHELVQAINGEKIISKNKANSFVDTDLLSYLKENKITDIVICGMQTHMCVEAAARAACDLGFTCFVIEDACTTRDLNYDGHVVKATDVHNSTLSTLNGTYAKIFTVHDFISKYFESELN